MNPALRSKIRSALPIALALAVASPAFAAPPDDPGASARDIEELAARARALFQEQKYEESIGYYLRAYRIAPAGALLYNIAFIYDKKLGERELAIDFYRRYIGSPDADPDVVHRATVRLGELKTERDPRATPGPVDRPLDNGDTGAPGTTGPPKPGPDVVAPAPAPWQTRVGWSLVGGGAASVVAGVVLGVVAQGTHDDFSASTDPSGKPDLQSDGRAQSIAADVLMSVGAAALATGIVLVIVAPERAAPVAIAPVEGGAVAVFGGRF